MEGDRQSTELTAAAAEIAVEQARLEAMQHEGGLSHGKAFLSGISEQTPHPVSSSSPDLRQHRSQLSLLAEPKRAGIPRPISRGLGSLFTKSSSSLSGQNRAHGVELLATLHATQTRSAYDVVNRSTASINSFTSLPTPIKNFSYPSYAMGFHSPTPKSGGSSSLGKGSDFPITQRHPLNTPAAMGSTQPRISNPGAPTNAWDVFERGSTPQPPPSPRHQTSRLPSLERSGESRIKTPTPMRSPAKRAPSTSGLSPVKEEHSLLARKSSLSFRQRLEAVRQKKAAKQAEKTAEKKARKGSLSSSLATTSLTSTKPTVQDHLRGTPHLGNTSSTVAYQPYSSHSSAQRTHGSQVSSYHPHRTSNTTQQPGSSHSSAQHTHDSHVLSYRPHHISNMMQQPGSSHSSAQRTHGSQVSSYHPHHTSNTMQQPGSSPATAHQLRSSKAVPPQLHSSPALAQQHRSPIASVRNATTDNISEEAERVVIGVAATKPMPSLVGARFFPAGSARLVDIRYSKKAVPKKKDRETPKEREKPRQGKMNG